MSTNQNIAVPEQGAVQRQQARQPPGTKWGGYVERYVQNQGDWLEKTRGNLMLVAVLIATIAFQAATNPPGGVWDHDGCPQLQGQTCEPGTSVFAHTQKDSYHWFIACNTISFSASLSIMLLVVSGFPLKNRFFMWFLIAAMCFTIFFMAASYMISARLVAVPKDDTIRAISKCYIYFWVVLLVVVVLFYVISFLLWLVRKMLACFCNIILCR